MKIFIGADHGGKELKENLIKHLEENAFDVKDMFIDNESEIDDYPDTAYLVCKGVMEEPGNLGIVICRDGIGMSIAANKYKGIRCARILDDGDAFRAKNHSDANVIALGSENGKTLEDIEKMVDTFIATKSPTEERRHRRINKIMQIESGDYEWVIKYTFM